MTDFRVEIPDGTDPYTSRELEWDNDGRNWSLSEKEYGEVRWTQHLDPTQKDLDSLLMFFNIDQTVEYDTLKFLSPGELTQVHQSMRTHKDILASLCSTCGRHWIVYKRDESGGWARYGRSCEFTWDRGVPATPQSDPLLQTLLTAQRGM